MKQLQHILVAHRAQGRNFVRIKGMMIGALHAQADFILRIAGQVGAQDALRKGAEIRPPKLLRGNGGDFIGNIQAAVGRDTAKHGFRRVHRGGKTTGTEQAHGGILLKKHLEIRP